MNFAERSFEDRPGRGLSSGNCISGSSVLLAARSGRTFQELTSIEMRAINLHTPSRSPQEQEEEEEEACDTAR